MSDSDKSNDQEDELFEEICRLVGIIQGREVSAFTMCIMNGPISAAEISLMVPYVQNPYRRGMDRTLDFDSYIPGYIASKKDIIERLRKHIEESK